ncbi:probable acyl-activating enzyme 17, peroxisomal isoform X2 [Amborella trichopoda]|uniref:probable acyl-activating enzyme 17, peroxisomal isoform X2 n=1 Tax=Amborella trichopoda TaxID=13333 RepID=UPI0005D391A3|nr:probable acyl-activating enzyme 17, peroxisomal isoform X2 [Amborella trichopoda]|eukprot:XP_011623292.1 probable acyl-activating enzyme 17, peroxisomal isoform X2 [Amborella trichopoda]
MAPLPLETVTVEQIRELDIPRDEAEKFYQKVQQILSDHGSCRVKTWDNISKHLLSPELPFALHHMMYYGCYSEWDATQLGPPPAWITNLDDAMRTNVSRVLERRGNEFLGLKYKDPISSFSAFQEFSVTNPEAYWRMMLDELNISFSVPPSCILSSDELDKNELSCPGGRWLHGAMLNSAKNCLLPKGRSMEDTSIIWRDEGYDELPLNYVTYRDLNAKVCLVANALEMLDLERGSAVAIDMPMNVTAVVAYLAIILAGYVVVSIADSFAAREISMRLNISKAKAIFTQDVIIRGDKSLPLYSRVVEAYAPLAIVLPARGSSPSVELREGDLSWDEFLARVKHDGTNDYTPVEKPVESFTNILFSSGTTGEPKAIPWTHMTPIKAAADGWVHMDILKGDIVAWPTNLGWMMGPWLVYASLLNGASMALYNGSPLGYGFAKFVQPSSTPAIGELALDPVMFGASTTLLNANHYDVYFKDMPNWNGKVLRRHGDEFERTAGGYYRAHGRTDDTMNLGGIKVSSIEIERICNGADESVLETAAIGVPPDGGGPEQLVIALVFKNPNHSNVDIVQLKKAFNSLLQQKLNPLFRVSYIMPTTSLPRTASNKIMRRILRQQFINDIRNSKL